MPNNSSQKCLDCKIFFFCRIILKDIDMITENPISDGIIELSDGVSSRVNRWTKFQIHLGLEEVNATEAYPQYGAFITEDIETLRYVRFF